MSEFYESPLIERYATDEMLRLFGADKKFSTWRILWLALARAQKELGLPVSDEAIEQMQGHLQDIDYGAARAYESRLRHDVMAHVHTFADAAPAARGVLHLGATSAYVTDNADLIICREALLLIRKRIVNLMAALEAFARANLDVATLGYTHFQPAQLTTVGKRACMTLTDLVMDCEELDFCLSTMRLRGAQGTTGTQASFMELFGGDGSKIDEMNASICRQLGFESCFEVTGQTYTRKLDDRIMRVLASVAQTLHKFGTDLRLLQHLKEIEEPIGDEQVGSSAMPYKQNPMKAERICSLARLVISLASNMPQTASVQWLERTLDDSANRRISVAEGFLACDAILALAFRVTEGLRVNRAVIRSNIDRELPFMATENLMMEAVKRGGDRQELHERIRVNSRAASDAVKLEGRENPLLGMLADDPLFPLDRAGISVTLDPDLYTGRAGELAQRFLDGTVAPILEKYKDLLGDNPELKEV